ncbi:MAG TPA: hypothetical protein VGH98_09570 [Gemmatimonadaceae bacterium]
MRQTLNRNFVSVALVVVVAACGSSSSPRLTGPATLTARQPLATLGTVGASLTPVPTFVVKDSGGRPLPNVSVSFVTSVGSVVTPTSVSTDANGVASPSAWILSSRPGFASLTALVSSPPLSTTVNVSVGAGPPSVLSIQPSLISLGLTDTTTLTSFVTDAQQNPLAGAPVTYTSSNTAVATISGSRVIAHGEGNAVITGSVTGTAVTATVPVSVVPRFGHLSGRPFGIAYVAGTPGSILVSSLDVNSVSFVNAGSFAVGSSVGVSQTPSDVFVNAQGTVAFVSAVDGPNVAEVNIASASLLQNLADGGSARVLLSPDGSQLYVGKNGGLDAFMLSTATRTASLPLGTQVNGVAVSADGSTLWASERFSAKVFRINTATMTVTDSLNVGGMPEDIVYHAASGNIYVANESGWVDVLSGSNLSSVTRFSGLPGAFALRLTADGSKLYISASSAGQVYVVDRATGSISRTLIVGGIPRRMVFLPDGRAAIANEAGYVSLVQ